MKTYGVVGPLSLKLTEGARNKRADIIDRMLKAQLEGNRIMKIDAQIEIVKLIQRIFDNCSEREIYVGNDCYDTKLELENICWAIERTIEDLVNEKLRAEKES